MTGMTGLGFRQCEWANTDVVPRTRCAEEAVATVVFRVPTEVVLGQTRVSDGGTRQIKRTCRPHIQGFIDFYWSRLREPDAYIRIRQTPDYIEKHRAALEAERVGTT